MFSKKPAPENSPMPGPTFSILGNDRAIKGDVSASADLHIDGLAGEPLRAVFIRAPLISRVGEGVRVLARLDADRGERIVAVRQGNVLATSFHPELTPDLRLHQYFLDMLA